MDAEKIDRKGRLSLTWTGTHARAGWVIKKVQW